MNEPDASVKRRARPLCLVCKGRIPLVTHSLQVPKGYTPSEHPSYGPILKVTRRKPALWVNGAGKRLRAWRDAGEVGERPQEDTSALEDLSVWCGAYEFSGLFHSGVCAKAYGFAYAEKVYGDRTRGVK